MSHQRIDQFDLLMNTHVVSGFGAVEFYGFGLEQRGSSATLTAT